MVGPSDSVFGGEVEIMFHSDDDDEALLNSDDGFTSLFNRDETYERRVEALRQAREIESGLVMGTFCRDELVWDFVRMIKERKGEL